MKKTQKQNKTKAISPLKVFPHLGKPMTLRQIKQRYEELEREKQRIKAELKLIDSLSISLCGSCAWNIDASDIAKNEGTKK